MNWSPKHSLIAGLGLIVVVNAIVLGGVAYNRSGEPESALRLSERELVAPMRGYGNKENSGLPLMLNWRVLPAASSDSKRYSGANALAGGAPEWLDQAKMRALGFDMSVLSQRADGAARTRQGLARDVLLVLELDGAAYQTALARAVQHSQTAAAQEATPAGVVLKHEQENNSRRFVVDAGLDVAALRIRHPDRSRYAIVRGQVRPNWSREKDAVAPAGFISGVSSTRLNLPLEWRRVLEVAAMGRDGPAPLRYVIDVHFGQRLEPWVAQAMRVAPSQ